LEEEIDPLLDLFIPDYELAERHHVRVAVPAGFAFATATHMSLQKSAIIHAIFKAREVFMAAKPARRLGLPFLEQMRELGWRVLAEVPGREIIMGAATQPWEPNPVFHGLGPEEFLAFNQPNFVKIAWTLRADPLTDAESIVRTETRVLTTDEQARSSFGRYWSLVAPGAVLVRLVMLRRIKKEAERRMRAEEVAPLSA
jgi:hypothetical protein